MENKILAIVCFLIILIVGLMALNSKLDSDLADINRAIQLHTWHDKSFGCWPGSPKQQLGFCNN